MTMRAIFKQLFSVRTICRAIGSLVVAALLCNSCNLLYESRIIMYGATRFVRPTNVIYYDLWHFMYTNPGAMVGEWLECFLFIAVPVLLLSVSLGYIMKKFVFKANRQIDTTLVAILVISTIACIHRAIAYNRNRRLVTSRFELVKSCQTLADYENLCGKCILHKIVDEQDKEFVDSLGRFKDNGYAPGRELYVFCMESPNVYILVWLENGKIIQRNACYWPDGFSNSLRSN